MAASQATTPQAVDAASCHFFKLPAELRNQIYDLAHEDPSWGRFDFPPRPTPLNSSADWNNRSWQYYALTQVSRQIRAEYRPIWIRQLRVRLVEDDISPFIETFLQDIDIHGQAPKLVQISWSRNSDEYTSMDLTPLLVLQARAHKAQIRFEFIPAHIVEVEEYDRVLCRHCLDLASSELFGHKPEPRHDCKYIISEELQLAWHEADCSHMDIEVVEALLWNDNDLWREAILTEQFKVHFRIRSKRDIDHLVMFTFICNDTAWKAVGTFDGAFNAFDDWGLIGYISTEANFELVYEEIKRADRGHRLVRCVVKHSMSLTQ